MAAAAYDLFLSYRRADAPRLEPLVAALQSLGLREWRVTRETDALLNEVQP